MEFIRILVKFDIFQWGTILIIDICKLADFNMILEAKEMVKMVAIHIHDCLIMYRLHTNRFCLCWYLDSGPPTIYKYVDIVMSIQDDNNLVQCLDYQFCQPWREVYHCCNSINLAFLSFIVKMMLLYEQSYIFILLLCVVYTFYFF